MHLLEFVPLLSVFLIASLGLGSMTLALMVWRRRRLAIRNQNGAWAVIGRLVLPLGVIGSLAIILSLSLRTFFPRKGELFVRDTIVVRADPDRGAPVVASADDLAAGDVLASFERPGLRADLAGLELERERIANERAMLRESPPALDTSFVRQLQEAATERRNLEQRLALFQVEAQRLDQAARSDILDKRLQRHEIQLQIGEYSGRLAKLQAEVEFESRLLEQGKNLRADKLLSETEYARRVRDNRVVRADIARLERELREKRLLLAELEDGIARLESTLTKHETFVRTSTNVILERHAQVKSEQAQLDKRLDEEKARQARYLATQLRDLELRRSHVEKQIERLHELVEVKSSIPGRVLFRHESPAAAQIGEPILMFGPTDAVRTRFRLSQAEAAQLAEAGVIDLMAVSHELIDARFTGRLASTTPLAHEPGMVLAEFACEPTRSQSRYLARGLDLDVRLIWAPAPYKDPLFLLGVALLAIAIVPAVVDRRQGSAPHLDVRTAGPTHAKTPKTPKVNRPVASRTRSG